MNGIGNLKEFYGLLKKPEQSTKEGRMADAKTREHQRRVRKEQLYSYPPLRHKSVKNP
jgi:hypothetical protein